MKSYKLTKAQQKAFRELELALLKCERENVFLWSDYGTISAVNGKVIEVVAPDPSLKEPLDNEQVSIIVSKDVRENSDDLLFVKRHVT